MEPGRASAVELDNTDAHPNEEVLEMGEENDELNWDSIGSCNGWWWMNTVRVCSCYETPYPNGGCNLSLHRAP